MAIVVLRFSEWQVNIVNKPLRNGRFEFEMYCPKGGLRIDVPLRTIIKYYAFFNARLADFIAPGSRGRYAYGQQQRQHQSQKFSFHAVIYPVCENKLSVIHSRIHPRAFLHPLHCGIFYE